MTTLRETLETARFLSGERFELVIKPERGITHSLFENTEDGIESAACWLAVALATREAAVADRYFCLNPVKADANPPARVRDEDIAEVRWLVVDIDPGDEKKPGAPRDEADPLDIAPEKRAACREVAEQIRHDIGMALGDEFVPPWIDSGRGQQLWLTAPGHVGRAAALNMIAGLYDRDGLCHVDRVVHNQSRLVRLPGSVNSKTGDMARIVKRAGEW